MERPGPHRRAIAIPPTAANVNDSFRLTLVPQSLVPNDPVGTHPALRESDTAKPSRLRTGVRRVESARAGRPLNHSARDSALSVPTGVQRPNALRSSLPGSSPRSSMGQITATNRAQKYARFDVLDFYRFGGALFVALSHYVYLYFPVAVWVKEYVGLL